MEPPATSGGMTPLEPVVGSRWQHTNGNFYTVVLLANKHDNPRYPRTVVYAGDNGEVWARPASDWHRSMTLVSTFPLVNRKLES